MPQRQRTIALQPPIGGIVKRHAVQSQEPYTTPGALNVLGQDHTVSEDGRDRISTRPGLTATGGSIGVPRAYAEANWTSSGAQRGILIACDNGCWKTQDGATFVELITDAASSDFASCASFLGVAYFARGGQDTLYRALSSGSGTGTALSAAGGGVAPTKCGIVGAHLDRLWLMGDTDNSQTVYISKTGDPTNWNYADTTLGASIPVSFTLPEQPTAFVSHTRDCALIHCVDSIYAYRGNPAGGELAKVSHTVGALSQSALTHDSAGNLWYMSRDGLYRMAAGCGDFSQSVSREALPVDLVAVNPGTAGTYCSVCYDPRFRLLWIYVDQDGTSNDVFWSYDLQNGAWFQHSFSNGPLRVGALLKSASTLDDSAILAINSTGNVYQYARDSGESFSSHCWIGPISLGGPGLEGILHSLQATVGAGSDAISWQVYVAGSAEQAFGAASASFTGADWTAGLNYLQHPTLRGAFAYLKIFGTTSDRWSLEGLECTLSVRGKRRAGQYA